MSWSSARNSTNKVRPSSLSMDTTNASPTPLDATSTTTTPSVESTTSAAATTTSPPPLTTSSSSVSSRESMLASWNKLTARFSTRPAAPPATIHEALSRDSSSSSGLGASSGNNSGGIALGMGAGFSSKKRPTVVALTPRVLLCWLPSKAKEASAALSELAAQLTSHKFMIFNVSGSDLRRLSVSAAAARRALSARLPAVARVRRSRSVSPLRAFSLASPLNVAVIQGSQDAWQADLLAAALLLFTRFTADPRTALAFVAYRVAQSRLCSAAALVRARHALHRHAAAPRAAPQQRAAPTALSHCPQRAGARHRGRLSPAARAARRDGAPLWSNCAVAAAEPPTSSCARCRTFRRVAATRRCRFRSSRRRSSTATSRCASTHIDVGRRARVTKRPMFSAWHHTAFIDGEGSCCVWRRRSLTCGPSCAARSTTSLRST
jgi:hypothetical protein